MIATTPKGMTVAKALQTLGSATVKKVIELTGRPPSAVKQSINLLYLNDKIHIGGYVTNKRGLHAKVWVWGEGEDAKEPSGKVAFIPRPDVAAAWLRNPI